MRATLAVVLIGGSLAASAMAPAQARTVRGTNESAGAWGTIRLAATVPLAGMEGESGSEHDNPGGINSVPNHESPGR
jgi:hypothetical protein